MFLAFDQSVAGTDLLCLSRIMAFVFVSWNSNTLATSMTSVVAAGVGQATPTGIHSSTWAAR